MKIAAQLLLACVVLTALKALITVLLLTLSVTLATGLIWRPAETTRATMTILGTLVFVGQPVLCLIGVAAIVAAGRLAMIYRVRKIHACVWRESHN